MNILITGGASGLGEAITRALAEEKQNHVFFTYFRSKESARAIEKQFSNTTAIPCDFKNKNEIAALLERMKTMGLDVLINNAVTGIELKHFHEMPPELFLERFKENILPVIAVTGCAIAIFRKRGSGRIITVLTSYLSQKPPVGLSAYVAEKAYLASLNKSWAIENARFNISSNAISPSFMLTGLTKDVDPRLLTKEAEHALDPKEIAQALIRFLNEPEGANGTDILIKASLIPS